VTVALKMLIPVRHDPESTDEEVLTLFLVRDLVIRLVASMAVLAIVFHAVDELIFHPLPPFPPSKTFPFWSMDPFDF
jgi:hypothetical protein